jgi:kynurenine formamidase
LCYRRDSFEAEEELAIIDLSHTLEDGMITYRGLPAPVVCDFLSYEASRSHYAPGTEFQIAEIRMVANTATYVDVPSHRFVGAKDLSEVSLDALAHLEAVVVRPPAGERRIDVDAFAGVEVSGRAVLVATGWDSHWRTDQYFEGHPFLTEAAARYLAQSGARLVGIDSLNIDDIEDGRRPVHTCLLGSEIPIVEHLTGLQALPDQGFRFTAAPVKVRGAGTFPVRAFALV